MNNYNKMIENLKLKIKNFLLGIYYNCLFIIDWQFGLPIKSFEC